MRAKLALAAPAVSSKMRFSSVDEVSSPWAASSWSI